MSLMPEFEEEEIEFIKPTEEQIEEARKSIKQAYKYIENFEYGLSAYILRDIKLSKISGIDELAHILASEEYGCCKEDVLGLIEHLEQVIRGEMPVSQRVDQMIFGKDEKGYGITVESENNKILITTRKGNAVTKISLKPKEARKMARRIYDIVKEVE